jgi:methylenetetrahydrofolate dehydrogenase (NADP+)/methenyltetrahydrofolate cyclohydrolase
MSAEIIDGAAHAAALRDRVAAEVRRLQTGADVTPGLAVVLVGANPASQVYVRSKSGRPAPPASCRSTTTCRKTPARRTCWR